MAGNTIYIHIGTHKTGTSAIQDFCGLNKKLLEKKGILFPQKSRRHYYQCVDGRYVVTPAHHKHYQKLAKLSQKKGKDVVLSSETFSAVEVPSEIKACLRDVPVKIICYLRRQDALKQSYYNQMVKGGRVYQSIDEYEDAPVFDYYLFLERWASVFGKENMLVRVFEKQQFVNQDLIDDFLSLLGLEMTDDFLKLKKNPNPRLSLEVLEYMRYVNSLFKDKTKSRQFKKGIIAYSASRSEKDTTSIFHTQSLLTLEQKKAILNQYAQSNQKVARDYLGRSDGQLFYDPLDDADDMDDTKPIYKGLTDDQVLDITRHLCRNRRMKKMLLKAVGEEDVGHDAYSTNARNRIRNALTLIESD